MAVSRVLLDDAGWAQIEDILRKDQKTPAIPDHLLAHLRALRARSVLIEDDFLNRDFTDAYAYYYARNFRRHSKLCSRLLFFAEDLDFLLDATLTPRQQADRLQGSEHFLGFIVVRPIASAPLNEALLLKPEPPSGYEGYVLTKAAFKVHVFGAELCVMGMPMTQQDSRIGACAQAAAWTVTRFFHARHHGPFKTTVDLTTSALTNPDVTNNTFVPTGSESLSTNTLLAALRSSGREVLVLPRGNRPADIVNRYVDSGIPVIVILAPAANAPAHAVVATGHVYNSSISATQPKMTRGEFCEAFYVNDDQQGPNIRMAVRSGSSLGEASYDLDTMGRFFIVPLPSKVYLPAEKAEEIAWDALSFYRDQWGPYKNNNASRLGDSVVLGDELLSEYQSDRVVARTYLTYGWKFKERGVRNKHPVEVQALVMSLELPRFVYVTEFSLLGDLNGKSLFKRRVIATCVVDATGKHHEAEAGLFFHAPGFVRHFVHDERDVLQEEIVPVRDDTKYFPKVRGDTGFAAFWRSDGS